MALPAGLAILFAVAFCWPLFGHFGDLGIANDWDQHRLYHWVPYETVRSYGQIPLWNPFLCGGMPMLGNPQSRWLSPFFLLHLWLGPDRAIPVEIIAHIALAWLGAFVLGRVFGLSRIAAMAPAVVFAGCSALYLHIGGGHTGWLAYAYMPWALAAVARRRPFVAGALLALIIGEGGTYALPHTALALAVLAAYRSVTDRSVRPFADLALTCAIALCLAAPKLLVMHELMSRFPRLISSTETMDLRLLAEALFSRVQELDHDPAGHPYRFLEYGGYIGPIAFVLAVIGAVWSRRSAAPWLLVAGVGLALTVGYTLGGEYSPWALLHSFPIFESQHVPSRFILPAVLAIGMLAGFGVDALAPRLGVRHSLVALTLLAAGAIDAAMVGPVNLRYLFDEELTVRPRAQDFVQYRDESPETMYALARANMGALHCYEPLGPESSPVGINEPQYRGEQYLVEGGEVALVEWTPNRLVFEVASEGPNVLVVNQNHHTSWRVASGRGELVSYEGLLGVRVPAGTGRYVLAYRSERFIEGVALAAAALAVAAAAALYRRKRKAR